MEQEIPVGSSLRAWWFIALAVLAFAIALAGVALLVARHDAGIFVLLVGGSIAIASAVTAAVICLRAVFVQITPDGFVVRDRYGEREYTDASILCASLHSQAHYTSGERRATTRNFDVWVETDEGSAERIRMRNKFPIGSIDPLEHLINRILGHLYDQASAALADREAFEGEGWSLNSRELVVTRKSMPETVPIDELAAAEVFDNDLCIWKHGIDDPIVRIPMSAANVPVLQTLLRERIVHRPEKTAASNGSELGRVLFERKPSGGSTIALWVMPISSASLLLGGLIATILMQRSEPVIVLGVFSALLFLIWLVPFSQHVSLRCHEHGVSRRWLRREQKLRYADMDSFTYSAIRQYVKGVYSGTSFTLTFTSNVAGKSSKVTYTKTLRNADEELERLRDRVGRILAERMAERFSTGDVVPWGESLKFFPEGLEYRANGFLKRKPPVMIPFEQIAGIDISDGVFRLWRTGQKGHVVKEAVAQPNFFPGYFLLMRLLAVTSTRRTPTETAGVRD